MAVIIPKEIRERLKIKDGEKIYFEEVKLQGKRVCAITTQDVKEDFDDMD